MRGDEFRCAQCGETFLKERSDEEALAESRGLWGETPGSDLAVICDDCFRRLMKPDSDQVQQ